MWLGLTLLACCVPAAWCLVHISDVLGHPFQLDVGEGGVLNFALMLAQRGTYFLPVTSLPLVHGSYPPVFPFLTMLLAGVLGFSLFTVRMVAVLGTLAAVGALFVLLRRLTARPLLAASLALLFLAPDFAQQWAPLGRVDTLAIFFAVLGLHLHLRAARDNGGVPALAIACFVLAFFTKQNFILAPVAVCLGTAVRFGVTKALVRSAATYVLTVALLIASGNVWTDGEFVRHLFTYTAVLKILPDMTLARAGEFLVATWPLLLLGAAGLALGWRGLRRSPAVIPVIYFSLSMLTMAVSGREGANVNFLLEPLASVIILAGAVIPLLPPRLLVLAPLAMAVQTAVTTDYTRSAEMVEPDASPRHVIAQLLRQTEGDVLCEDLSALIAAGKPVLLDPNLFVYMPPDFPAHPVLEEACRAQRFPLIIAGWRFVEMPGLAQCLRTHYASRGLVANFLVLEPLRPPRQAD